MNKHNFHVVGLPNTVTSDHFSGCAYTKHIKLFCEGMHKLGHNVYHYGNYGSELDCTENIIVTNKNYIDENINGYKDKEYHHNLYDSMYLSPKADKTFNSSAGSRIRLKAIPKDFVILTAGSHIYGILTQIEDLLDMPLFAVESSVGYIGSWQAPYKVFESDSIRSWNRAQWNEYWNQHCNEKEIPVWAINEGVPQFTDDIINTFIDPTQFRYNAKKEDYFLYLGRVVPSKGVDMAVNVCERIGAKLVIAGPGDVKDGIGRDTIPDFVEYVGFADIQKRKELMANARGAFCLTYYNEHGGNIVHEYGLSGTPVIATNWGCFTHSVLHNVTGYLVQDEMEAVWAAENIDNINPEHCRKWNMNYTVDKTIPRFERYFDRIKSNWECEGKVLDYPLENLDHREMIHPYDLSYDMNLKPAGVKGTQGPA